jgi:FkbM family methyltransferase
VKSVFPQFARTFAHLTSWLAERIKDGPSLLESKIQEVQGKGWGAQTTSLEVKFANSILESKGIQSPVVFDVGANRGDYISNFLLINPFASIHAFEPQESAFKILESKFKSDKRVNLYRKAVGESVGTSVLYSDQTASGLASLTRRRLNHFGIEFNISENVERISLDSMFQKTKIRPHIIKIDVEGHELDVLHGAESLIRDVELIQFEFGGCNIDTRTYFQDFWYFFADTSLSLYRISKRGLIPIHRYDENLECFRPTNYLAFRSDEIV